MTKELIEVGFEDALFHLDVVFPTRFSKDQRTQRYISSCLASVVDLLTTHHPTESRVTIQGKYEDGEPYRFKMIEAIYLVGSRSGPHYFLCDCEGEQIAFGGDHRAEIFAEPKRIWPRHSHLSWDSVNRATLSRENSTL